MYSFNIEIKNILETYLKSTYYDMTYDKVINTLYKKLQELDDGNLYDHIRKQLEEKRKLYELELDLEKHQFKLKFSDILKKNENIEKKFARLNINSLNEEQKYNIYQISALTNNFNTDVGMYNGYDNDIKEPYIVIKCTLHDSPIRKGERGYYNEMLNDGTIKYYFQRDKGSSKIKNSIPNQLILNSINHLTKINVYTFINHKKGLPYKYSGIYYPSKYSLDENGYYFILRQTNYENIFFDNYGDIVKDVEGLVDLKSDYSDGTDDDVNKLIEVLVRNSTLQNEFKDKLLRRECKCALCDITYKQLLIASHIKPFHIIAKETISNEEKKRQITDVKNGLLLCANHDAFFDKGLISFDKDGYILINEDIPQDIIENLLSVKQINKKLFGENYMHYHRSKVFKS